MHNQTGGDDGHTLIVTRNLPSAYVSSAVVTSRLSDGAVRLFILLKMHAGKDGRCFPSNKVLATEIHGKVGRSERSIQDLKCELREAGLIQWRSVWDPERGRKSIRYDFPEGPPSGNPLPDTIRHHSAVSPPPSGKSAYDHPANKRTTIRQPTAVEVLEVNLEELSLPQSFGSLETADAPAPNRNEGASEEWFTPNHVSELRTTIEGAWAGGVVAIGPAKTILRRFRDEREYRVWMKTAFTRIRHHKAKTPGMYRAEAEKWVETYRQDVADGRTDVYEKPAAAAAMAEGGNMFSLVAAERAALATKRAGADEPDREGQREAEQARYLAARNEARRAALKHREQLEARAGAGDIAAKLAIHIGDSGRGDKLSATLLALEDSRGRIVGNVLELTGSDATFLRFSVKPRDVLPLLPEIGIDGVGDVAYHGFEQAAKGSAA